MDRRAARPGGLGKFSLYLAAVLAVFFFLLRAPGVCEAVSDDEMARHLAMRLGDEFEPESLFVTVSDSRAYAEARGVYLSGVRLDTLKLEAILGTYDLPEEDGGVEALASLIAYSWGEVVLLEEDINRYFKAHETRGFSGLNVKFSESGFRAEGIFSASFLFTLRMRLQATGTFALKPDGVYIADADIFVEGLRQPGFLVSQVMERANPLIEWSEIPFKITFKEIYLDDSSATMTGGPQSFREGASAVWEKDRPR
ncbi:MAG: DUF2993 domain-containing protein [Synergistaceae bacterium]|jgi:hypothetical protein|nr:DUF2993 domain-containing protein [Synergistaceae bacterium]